MDANGHANNVEYVRWMQQAAISHADFVGCTKATKRMGSSWVVRSHEVEYLQPAYAGDKVVVLTWVSRIRKASSLRKYVFVRQSDQAVIARGATNWVFVDAQNGRAKPIPPEVSSAFEIVSLDEEPLLRKSEGLCQLPKELFR
jgi:acyl-CoA thioester hydrolase